MKFNQPIMVFILVCVGFFSVQAFATDDHATNTNTTATIAAETSNNPAEKIDLNTATAEQLESLKGIGASKTKTIIDYRTKHGAFKSMDDLANVPGFSKKVVSKLVNKNPNLTVNQ